MCMDIEPAWYRPLDDDGEEQGDTLYFGCSGEHEGWFGSVEQDGDGWAWCVRLATERPQRIGGYARSEATAREIVETFAAADELAWDSGEVRYAIADEPACAEADGA